MESKREDNGIKEECIKVIYTKNRNGKSVKVEVYECKIGNKIVGYREYVVYTKDKKKYLIHERKEEDIYNHWRTDYYENGQSKFKGEYLNGKKNGLCQEWTENGKVKFEGEYLNGEKNGEWIEYYEDKEVGRFTYENDKIVNGKGQLYNDNGMLIFEGEYLNGKKNGEYKEYYDNGKPKIIANYQNDQKHGKYFEYDDNGKPKIIANYQNDQKHGEYFKYDDNRKLKIIANYQNDQRNDEYIAYRKNKEVGRFTYENDKIVDGEGELYNNNGVLIFKGKYSNGKKNGECKEYHDNGKLKFEGEYVDGQRNGFCIDYNENEKKEYQGKYSNGKKNGKHTTFSYGEVSLEIDYQNDQIDGLYREYCSDGTMILKAEYKNGKKNGEYAEWDGDGKLKVKTAYKDDEIDGSYTEWDYYFRSCDDNELNPFSLDNSYERIRYIKKKGYFKNGEKHGKWIEYYDGKPKFEGEYLNGKKHGQWKEYYNDGKLKFEGEYKNDLKDGKGKEYNKFRQELIFEGEYLKGERWNGIGKEYLADDRLIFEGKYLNGERWNGKVYEWYNSDSLKSAGEYLNGKKHGQWREYYNDARNCLRPGTLKFKGEYLNGEKNGECKEYHDNGKLKFEGEYLNGEKNGECKEYHDNGKLKFEGEYLNGDILNGKQVEYYNNGKTKFIKIYKTTSDGKKVQMVEYYDNGQLKSEGEYLNGKKHGQWKEWYDNGQLKSEGEYLNGKKHGQWKEWYENGQSKFEGEYKNDLMYDGILKSKNGNVIHKGVFLDNNIKNDIKEKEDFLSKHRLDIKFDKIRLGKQQPLHQEFEGLIFIGPYFFTKMEYKNLLKANNDIMEKIKQDVDDDRQIIISIIGESTATFTNRNGSICGTALSPKMLDDIIKNAINSGVKIIKIDNITCNNLNRFTDCTYNEDDIDPNKFEYKGYAYLHEKIIEYAKKYPSVTFYYGHVGAQEAFAEETTRFAKIIVSNGEAYEKVIPEEIKVPVFEKTIFDDRIPITDRILKRNNECVIELNDKLTIENIESIIKDNKDKDITISITQNYNVKKDDLDFIINKIKQCGKECIKIDNHNTSILNLYDKNNKVACDINDYIDNFLLKNNNFNFYYGQFRKNDQINEDNYNNIPVYTKFYVEKDYIDERGAGNNEYRSEMQLFKLKQKTIELYNNVDCEKTKKHTFNDEFYNVLSKYIKPKIDNKVVDGELLSDNKLDKNTKEEDRKKQEEMERKKKEEEEEKRNNLINKQLKKQEKDENNNKKREQKEKEIYNAEKKRIEENNKQDKENIDAKITNKVKIFVNDIFSRKKKEDEEIKEEEERQRREEEDRKKQEEMERKKKEEEEEKRNNLINKQLKKQEKDENNNKKREQKEKEIYNAEKKRIEENNKQDKENIDAKITNKVKIFVNDIFSRKKKEDEEIKEEERQRREEEDRKKQEEMERKKKEKEKRKENELKKIKEQQRKKEERKKNNNNILSSSLNKLFEYDNKRREEKKKMEENIKLTKMQQEYLQFINKQKKREQEILKHIENRNKELRKKIDAQVKQQSKNVIELQNKANNINLFRSSISKNKASQIGYWQNNINSKPFEYQNISTKKHTNNQNMFNYNNKKIFLNNKYNDNLLLIRQNIKYNNFGTNQNNFRQNQNINHINNQEKNTETTVKYRLGMYNLLKNNVRQNDNILHKKNVKKDNKFILGSTFKKQSINNRNRGVIGQRQVKSASYFFKK